MPAKKKEQVQIDVHEIVTGELDICILGTMPFICNRVSEKAKRELLFPGKKKTAATKAVTLKHDPIQEFRASPYTSENPKDPTLLQILAVSFKRAMMGAALDTPGTKKAQIGRLVWVRTERVALYGVPQLFMSITRSADMNRTPDVRTRAILPEWCCRISIQYAMPMLTTKAVGNLLASAGLLQGVGDWRNEKGSGTYGQFICVPETNKDFRRIMKAGGRKVQVKALKNPEAYDRETAELLEWFHKEIDNRGLRAVI